jgi:hypothetical protein
LALALSSRHRHLPDQLYIQMSISLKRHVSLLILSEYRSPVNRTFFPLRRRAASLYKDAVKAPTCPFNIGSVTGASRDERGRRSGDRRPLHPNPYWDLASAPSPNPAGGLYRFNLLDFHWYILLFLDTASKACSLYYQPCPVGFTTSSFLTFTSFTPFHLRIYNNSRRGGSSSC